MNKALLAAIGSLTLMGTLLWWLMRDPPRSTASPENGAVPTVAKSLSGKATSAEPLKVLCAAASQAVMETIRGDYEAATGRTLTIQYGASQTLLSQIEVSGIGDLYLPADDSFLKLAQEKQLVEEILPGPRMRVVVAVKKGNPKNIRSLADLHGRQVRLVQASPEAAAVAKLTRQVLTEQGTWDSLHKATMAYRTTVNDVANDVLVDSADAGIVYDAVLHTYPGLEAVDLPELKEAVSQVSVGVVTSGKRPTAALHFARFLTARDRGLIRYKEHGFQVAEGDVWQDRPELTIYAGSMLRPAIEDTIIAFEQREGVRVSRSYNGCGILVAQMKSGQHPDAYFACDVEFMSQVTDLFPKSVAVSQNELVILVPKGNPKNIQSLRDLTQKGLRVGIGHEKQCAMGWITQKTFKESGIQTEVMANVTVQTPTGDMLVNQLRTGSLDVAVAYLSNAAGSSEHLDAIQIQGLPCSVATQPWAVAQDSKHAQLADRLFQKICSAQSQDIFLAEGFRWQLAQPGE
jgi:molybdenum ABC transporter molybdate-binding protein